MDGIIEFLGSLGIVGWLLLILCVLIIFNLRKILRLRSPLDTPQHKLWRNSDVETKADHLDKKDIDF